MTATIAQPKLLSQREEKWTFDPGDPAGLQSPWRSVSLHCSACHRSHLRPRHQRRSRRPRHCKARVRSHSPLRWRT